MSYSVAIEILKYRPATYKKRVLELWRARLRAGTDYPPVKVSKNENGFRVISGDVLLQAAIAEGLTRVECEFL